MIRNPVDAYASIEETLALWAASLREIKKRIRPLLGKSVLRRCRLVSGRSAYVSNASRLMRAEAAGDLGPWRQQAILVAGTGMLMLCANIVRDLCHRAFADDDRGSRDR